MSKRMNVLFFITDQQRADHLGCAGNKILKTPNLDRLASESMLFNSAYVANPVCMPNRCCIFTGLYPNMHVRTQGVNLPEDVPTFTETLRKEGYTTKAIGKMHLQWWVRPTSKHNKSAEDNKKWRTKRFHDQMREDFPKNFYGFNSVDLIVGHGDCCNGHYTDWLEERAPQYVPIIDEVRKTALDFIYRKTPIPEEFYPTSYCTDRAVDFLEKYSKGEYGDEPFFLNVSYPDPHHPVTPPGKWAEMYKPEDMELPESFTNVDYVRNHKFLGDKIDHVILRRMIHRTTNEEEARNFIAHTYGTLSMIDYSVGQILASLEKLGLADNTIILYTSDHGDMAGDQGMILKGFLPFNGILNVPLIWKVPGMTKGDISDSLVSAIDLAPTILNLCGVNKKNQPPDMQGVDVTPVLKDPTSKVRDSCLVEFDAASSANRAMRLKYLITDRYNLTLYNEMEGYGDLFDRKNDPHELNNLWFTNPELRCKLLEKIFHETLKAQSLYPHRQAQT